MPRALQVQPPLSQSSSSSATVSLPQRLPCAGPDMAAALAWAWVALAQHRNWPEPDGVLCLALPREGKIRPPQASSVTQIKMGHPEGSLRKFWKSKAGPPQKHGKEKLPALSQARFPCKSLYPPLSPKPISPSACVLALPPQASSSSAPTPPMPRSSLSPRCWAPSPPTLSRSLT